MNEITIVKKELTSIENQWVEQSKLDKSVFDKELSFALQHIEKNPYLLKCSRNSIIKSLLNVAQTGLTLNPVSKYAYLVPRKGECVLDPSYQGLVKLLTDSGVVKSISANIVYEGDDIEFDYSSDKKVVKHVPYIINGNDKGKEIACYSIAKLDDSYHVEIMSIKDIEEIRDKSESYKSYKAGKSRSCVWETYRSEMIRKTVIKRHFKYLPKSDGLDKFNNAVQVDNYANGYDEEVNYNSIAFIESLIDSSILSPELKERCQSEMMSIEYQSQAIKMINYLKQNQGDPRDNLANQAIINKAIDQSMSLD